jgi:hypothetical protein
MLTQFNELSSAELRLDLAVAESQKPNSLRAICLKRDKVRDITNELIRRGSY